VTAIHFALSLYNCRLVQLYCYSNLISRAGITALVAAQQSAATYLVELHLEDCCSSVSEYTSTASDESTSESSDE
jgi:hypothetical protein